MTKLIHQPLGDRHVGIQNIRHRHVDILGRFARDIGPLLDVHQLIDKVTQYTSEIFGADVALLLLHALDSQTVWTNTHTGPGAWPKRLRFDDDLGLAGYIFQHLEPVRFSDACRHYLYSSTACKFLERIAKPVHSVMATPVLNHDVECIAILEVADRRANHFSEADLSLLQHMAVYVGICLENAQRFDAQKRQFETMIHAVSNAIDARDAFTQSHSANVANYAVGIGLLLGLDNRHLQALRLAALLRDIGKISTPDRILTKVGRLEAQEFEEVKKHARYTRQILAHIEFAPPYEDTPNLAAAHHEKLDGSGYPDGLAGTEVPLKARILTVADIFHTLTQPRHYRLGMPLTKAISILDDLAPHQLDDRCVIALKAFVGIGPAPMPAA